MAKIVNKKSSMLKLLMVGIEENAEERIRNIPELAHAEISKQFD